MRITETRMLELMSGRTMKTQSQLAEAGERLSSGVAVDRPSDDPVRWADGMRAKLSMGRRDTHESTVERARDNLVRVDVAMDDLFDDLDRVRVLAVMGGNETHSAENLMAAAVEVAAIFESMIGSANIRSIDGEYLLSGTNSDVAPFDANGVFQGNDVIRQIEAGDGVMKDANISGSLLTAAEGVDIFATVNDVRLALEANDSATVRSLLADVDSSLIQLADARSQAGVAANALDASLDVLSGLEVSLTETLETSVGQDPIEAATWLANLSNQLEASRAVSERIVSLMSVSG